MDVPRVHYYVRGPAPSASAAPPERVTVASFNVENWFDAVDDPGRDEGDTPPKPEEAKRAVAALIREAGADVVTLQEMENRAGLDELADRYLEPGRYPYRLLVEGNDGRGIDVAILSATRSPATPPTPAIASRSRAARPPAASAGTSCTPGWTWAGSPSRSSPPI